MKIHYEFDDFIFDDILVIRSKSCCRLQAAGRKQTST